MWRTCDDLERKRAEPECDANAIEAGQTRLRFGRDRVHHVDRQRRAVRSTLIGPQLAHADPRRLSHPCAEELHGMGLDVVKATVGAMLLDALEEERAEAPGPDRGEGADENLTRVERQRRGQRRAGAQASAQGREVAGPSAEQVPSHAQREGRAAEEAQRSAQVVVWHERRLEGGDAHFSVLSGTAIDAAATCARQRRAIDPKSTWPANAQPTVAAIVRIAGFARLSGIVAWARGRWTRIVRKAAADSDYTEAEESTKSKTSARRQRRR